MPRIHFLNVRDGDCSVIQHYSGHVSIIDVCNASPPASTEENVLRMVRATLEKGVGGNFNQKNHPVNPLDYLYSHGITSIFRYIQTHPDMDHMDGIASLCDSIPPINFWDTDNNKYIDPSTWGYSPYSKADWDFYTRIRDGKPTTNPTRLALYSGAKGKYYNANEDGSGGGDGIHVLAPTQALLEEANRTGDYNQCSYVLLYRTDNHKVIFGGDSHDSTWEHILDNHRNSVEDIDLLIAPHHGRDSGRAYDFLDVLKPSLTFFGNASSEHLAYGAWNSRGLPFVTNNQANCMVVDTSQDSMALYVTHEPFARAKNSATFYSESAKAWFVEHF